jgi:CHAT domain-containing protein/tetratricopeptide (TPR) repeat protein
LDRVISLEVGDGGGVGGAYGNLGNAYSSLGDFSQAIAYHEQHLEIAKEVGDRVGEGAAYGNLGIAYRSLGDFSQAIEYITKHLAIAKEVGERAGEGRAYGSLGNAYQSLGGFSKAIEYHTQHLSIAKEVGDRGGEGRAYGNLGCTFSLLEDFAKAIEYHTQHLAIAKEVGDRVGEGRACGNLGSAYQSLGDFSRAIEYLTEDLAIAKEVGNRAGEGTAYGNLGNLCGLLGDFSQAIEYHTQHLAIAKEVGDREGEGHAGNNLGNALRANGDLPAAARALVQGLDVLKSVERDVGGHDNRRVSLFEQQQKTYMLLQSVLLGLGQRGWALGVAAQAKARALAHRLGGGSAAAESDAAAAKSEAYEEVCGAWWAEVQEHARGQAAAAAGSTLRVLEYSLLFDDRLVIWVLSGAGELLGSATVPSTGFGGTTGRTVRDLLQEARGSMKVRGRETMASVSAELNQERKDQQSDDGMEQGEASSERGNTCKVCGLKFNQCGCQAADDEARERALLRELYAALVAPVEEHLTGAEEVLIVPHKELFEVPWAALIDAHGHFLIEHHVLRVAPSLRVAQQAAVSAAQGSARRPGHIVLVGNPLPIRSGFRSLPCAQQEAQGVHDILKKANVLVKSEHFFMSDSYPKATKANVKTSLKGAGWAHLACHGDIDTNSLVLAVPDSGDPDRAQPDLSMLEVQGSDEAADKRERVRLAEGATVVLSACNTGRGEIKAEGVVGLARGFLAAGAAAAVVSLWSVDDGSTAALMQQMYQYLGSIKGCTVPQALRLAMLRLARRPALDQPESEQDVSDGLQEAWKRPMHWAGFLVMGASTCLPSDGLTGETKEG